MRWKATTDKTARPRRTRQLTLTILDADQHQVWQAKVHFRAANADDFSLVEAIMANLIANMGKTVYALRVP